MNLIFIYGPPASGKLTIAKELSGLTGYSLFHNHQTRDIVHGLYPETLRENYNLVEKLRLDILKYAARHKTDIIFTFVYDDPEDITFINKVVKTVEDEKGTVLFVETTADDKALLSRVNNDTRKEHRKLTDKNKLKVLLDSNRYASLPYASNFKIDTTHIDPTVSASLIVENFQLL